MAEKRMFSSKIIDSDAFIEMSPMARLLYFSLALHADDDGFTNSIRREMKIVGAQDTDLKELIDNKFIIKFDSGVIAIKHWRVNNDKPKKDRYKITLYSKEMSQLVLLDNGEYALRNEVENSPYQNSNALYTDWNQVGTTDGNNTDTQNRVEENRVEENRLEETRLDESRTCVHESTSENQAESGQPSQESPIVYFPTRYGEQPIYQKDIDDLSKMFNGSVDVKNEIFSCMAYYSDKPEGVTSWQSAVKVWINRTINFNNATKFAIEQGMTKNNGRNHRSMEPDKYKDIIPEDAGL